MGACLSYRNKGLFTLFLFVAFPLYAKVTACSSLLWLPYNWELNNQLDGAGVTLAQGFFDTQSVPFAPVASGSWRRCLQLAKTGKIDLVIAAYKTAERARYAHYVPEPIGQDSIRIYVKRNSPISFTDFEQLRPYQGGGILGDSYGQAFDAFKRSLKKRPWIDVNEVSQVIGQLEKGRFDYSPMNPWNVKVAFSRQAQDQQLPLSSLSIKPVGPAINNSNLYFMFSKASNKYPIYGEKLAAYVKRMKQNGQVELLLEQSLQRYLQLTGIGTQSPSSK